MTAYLADNPGQGFGLLCEAFRAKGHPWGKTGLWRVYCTLKMNLPRRGKRRLPDRIQTPLVLPLAANHTWSADFMADALWSGRRFRTAFGYWGVTQSHSPARPNAVNDDFNRESLRIEIDTSLPSARFIRALDELIETRGKPQRLRLDNGPEFISQALQDWAARHGVALVHIQPGKPTQNAPTSSDSIEPSGPKSSTATSSRPSTTFAE